MVDDGRVELSSTFLLQNVDNHLCVEPLSIGSIGEHGANRLETLSVRLAACLRQLFSHGIEGPAEVSQLVVTAHGNALGQIAGTDAHGRSAYSTRSSRRSETETAAEK